MIKKILITGSNGLLGQKLVYKLAGRAKTRVIATSKGDNRLLNHDGYEYYPLDITNEQEVKTALNEFLPDVVINTAAMTNVDACELHKDDCWKMNVKAVSYFLNELQSLQNQHDNYYPHFIHLSTDFIFDGTKGPLTEDEKPNPLSYYAESKLASESLVERSKVKWAIARTVLVYGIVDNMSRTNIVLWAKSSLESGKKINVVTDQFRTPTLAEDLADGCILIMDKNAKGIFNISGADFMSVFELVERVADFWHLDKSLINPAKSEDIKQPAKRPPVTGFIIEKAKRELGYNPHPFEEGLKILDEQLKSPESPKVRE
jgi:dTDP-4-dehydrorhamnose reductase